MRYFRIQADDDPEYLGKIPTLDLINDLFNENKIDSLNTML